MIEKGGKLPDANFIANFNSIAAPSSSSVNAIFPASILLCKINNKSSNVFVVLNPLQTFFNWANVIKATYFLPF